MKKDDRVSQEVSEVLRVTNQVAEKCVTIGHERRTPIILNQTETAEEVGFFADDWSMRELAGWLFATFSLVAFVLVVVYFAYQGVIAQFFTHK